MMYWARYSYAGFSTMTVELEDNWVIDTGRNHVRLGHRHAKEGDEVPAWWLVMTGRDAFCTKCHKECPDWVIGYMKLYCWSMGERNIHE